MKVIVIFCQNVFLSLHDFLKEPIKLLLLILGKKKKRKNRKLHRDEIRPVNHYVITYKNHVLCIFNLSGAEVYTQPEIVQVHFDFYSDLCSNVLLTSKCSKLT